MCLFEYFHVPGRMRENSSPEIHFMQHPAPRTNVMDIPERVLCLKVVPEVNLFSYLLESGPGLEDSGKSPFF